MKERIKLLRQISDQLWDALAGGSVDFQDCAERLQNLADNLEMEYEYLEWKPGLVTIDFDGVLAEYKKPMTKPEDIEGNALPGAIQFLKDLIDHGATPIIFSARCNSAHGRQAIFQWLMRYLGSSHYLYGIQIQPGKPAAHIMIDDRAIQFNGGFPPVNDVLLFKPWYYEKTDWRENSHN